MTGKARQQAFILAALSAALAVVLYVQFGASLFTSSPTAPSRAPRDTAGSTRPPSNSSTGGGAPQKAGEPITDVKLELLQHDEAALDQPERNPFRFKLKPPPPPPPRPIGVPTRVESAPPPPVVPTGPPPPPPITLRFIGVIESPPPDTRVAILSDGRGGPPVPGREGDIIEGRYRLLRVGPDSLEIAYLDGRGRQTIRLSGQ